MHTCSTYQHRAPYAVTGSPLRGYHSVSRSDDNVLPSYSTIRGLTTKCRLPGAAAGAECRLRSNSDGRKSPSFASGSPDGASHMDCSLEYLADLVKEKKDLEVFGENFQHVDRLLSEEISRVRGCVVPDGKIYVPKREYPDYNFVGRILGPRGMTAKQLEQETGCKIMVRGKGSMRDKRKEEANRGKPNWEHLDDELHVLLQCEDTENRARIKLRAAMDHVKKLLVPAPEGTDELKRKQLMELAIINGTYRPYKSTLSSSNRIITPVPLVSPIRAPIFVSPTNSPNSVTCNPAYVGTNSQQPFDYSSFLNPNFLETALASFQIANELHLPTFPTATSLVNSFPSLFMNTSANTTATQEASTTTPALSPTKCF
ncbi:hypothetical protein KIN20_035597 [Parelaphostrongylus tenuis]|uniref:K Homology domain-containing protein n=1 Tax=Parelaphostrongylus tenuis TaxID=148309 RepID=A0AAD5WK22_PARTN|nr:hypothetical protein KIN20_035597 [Parelaphostrongylus tenuis]